MTTRQHVENVITEVAPKVTLSGAGTGIAGFLTSSHFVGLVGVGVALAGFVVSWYYKHKHYKLAEREALRRMEKMRTQPGDLQ